MSRSAAPTKEHVRELLVCLLVEIGKIPREAIRDGATVDGDLRMESVTFVEIQVTLEEALDIEVDLIEIVELNEFAAIVDYVHRQTQRSAPR